MNKKEFTAELAVRMETTKAQAEKMLSAMLDIKIETLVAGEEINFSGYYKLHVVDVAARDFRNPKTGEVVSKPAKKIVKAKVSKKFSEQV